jgi:nucleoside-diphosphate-sugar epimerase
VTIGAGFIGSNLAEKLSTDNDAIIIDDLSIICGGDGYKSSK